MTSLTQVVKCSNSHTHEKKKEKIICRVKVNIRRTLFTLRFIRNSRLYDSISKKLYSCRARTGVKYRLAPRGHLAFVYINPVFGENGKEKIVYVCLRTVKPFESFFTEQNGTRRKFSKQNFLLEFIENNNYYFQSKRRLENRRCFRFLQII